MYLLGTKYERYNYRMIRVICHVADLVDLVSLGHDDAVPLDNHCVGVHSALKFKFNLEKKQNSWSMLLAQY